MSGQDNLKKVVSSTSPALSAGLTIAIGVGVFALIGVGIYHLVGYCTRCPHCKEWWTVIETGRTLLKEENKSKDVEREDEHFDSQGVKTGITKRKERVYVIEKTFDVDRQCTKCKTAWVTREKVDV